MRELFSEDRSRQVAWVAEVSGPEPSRRSGEPLKPPSTFWAGEDAPTIFPTRPMAPSTPPSAFVTGEAPPRASRKLHYAAIGARRRNRMPPWRRPFLRS